jgi:hypothetical protein
MVSGLMLVTPGEERGEQPPPEIRRRVKNNDINAHLALFIGFSRCLKLRSPRIFQVEQLKAIVRNLLDYKDLTDNIQIAIFCGQISPYGSL